MAANDNTSKNIDNFIAWCVFPKTQGGAGLAEVTACSYVSALRSNPSKLTFEFPVNVDVFICNTTKDIANLIAIFKSAPEYEEINNRLHNQFSAALEQYLRFIKYIEDNGTIMLGEENTSNFDLLIENFDNIEMLINEELKEQKSIAHNAIDDVTDTDQYLQVVKIAHEKITKLNELKKQLSLLKTNIVSSDVISKKRTQTCCGCNQKHCFDEWYDSLQKQEHDAETEQSDGNDIKTGYTTKLTDNFNAAEFLSVNATGLTERKKPKRIQLFDIIFEVEHWNQILLYVCEEMINRKPEIANNFDKNKMLNSDRRIYFSYDKKDIEIGRKQLSNKMYVCTNFSAEQILSVCCKVLSVCGYSADSLKLYAVDSFYTKSYIRSDMGGTHDTKESTESTYRWQGIGDVISDVFGLESNKKQGAKGGASECLPKQEEIPMPIIEVQEGQISKTITINNKSDVIKPSRLVLPSKGVSGNREFLIDSWSSVLTKACEHLILISPYKMALIDTNVKQYESKLWYTYSESEKTKMENPKRLSNGLYIETGIESNEIFIVISELVMRCGYSQNTITVY